MADNLAKHLRNLQNNHGAIDTYYVDLRRDSDGVIGHPAYITLTPQVGDDPEDTLGLEAWFRVDLNVTTAFDSEQAMIDAHEEQQGN